MNQTSVAFEDLIVEELLAVRIAESRLASELQKISADDQFALQAAAKRLDHLQKRSELLASLLDDSTTETHRSFAYPSGIADHFLACA